MAMHCSWLRRLPEQLKQQARHGSVCCLFWPRPESQAVQQTECGQSWLEWWQGTTIAKSLQLLAKVQKKLPLSYWPWKPLAASQAFLHLRRTDIVQDAALNVRRNTRRVLEAVDWSKEGGSAPHSGEESPTRSRGIPCYFLPTPSSEQLRVVRLAAQEYLERFWQASHKLLSLLKQAQASFIVFKC